MIRWFSSFLTLTLVLSLGASKGNSSVVQSIEELQKKHDECIKKIADPSVKTFLLDFSKFLVNYDQKKITLYFDKEHYSVQMELYMTDTFMFNHLGEAGKRDRAKVEEFYIRETLGLSQMEEKEFLGDRGWKNWFYLTDFSKIKKFYYLDVTDEGGMDRIIFVVETESGDFYVGQLMILHDHQPVRIIGAVG